MSIEQSAVGWERLCVAGGSPEPVVSAERLIAAVGHNIEQFRALLPVGYEAGVAAYRQAANELTARDLAEHYTQGLTFFHEQFVPHVKQTLVALSGGVWRLEDFVPFAAGSDVDWMTHVIEGVAANSPVALFPGDWHGFRVGCTHRHNIHWDSQARASLACLCVPSVRNGQLTDEMVEFLSRSENCLLNLNLFPTFAPDERQAAAVRLAPLFDRAILSISFSRGFGLTASQLGVALVPRNHPYLQRFREQWEWHTYFYNAIAARAFMLIDLAKLAHVDALRRDWVAQWLSNHDLPVVSSGSYYVKAFRVSGVTDALGPLVRDDIARLCFKPPLS
jgi:hypothetical protein